MTEDLAAAAERILETWDRGAVKVRNLFDVPRVAAEFEALRETLRQVDTETAGRYEKV